MTFLPRVAVGSVHAGTDYRPALWGLMQALDHRGVKLQSFLPRSCLAEVDAASTITGTAPRHLDSWLMSREFCRQTFVRIARQFDLAIVEGDLSGSPTAQGGGDLPTLCDWLGLPRLGVLDVRGLADCRLPYRRPPVDALILDGVAGADDFYHRQTVIESHCGLPVVGALEDMPALAEAVRKLDPGQKPAADLCRALANQLLKYTDVSRLLDLAERQEFPTETPCGSPERATNRRRARPKLKVAVAYDEVFSGYFPDTLDALEQQGVTVCDFSTLRDESLPPDCDLVYIGCGRMQPRAAELSGNHCLQAALRDHVCSGRRIYAEGAGMAYLCQSLVFPMAGECRWLACCRPRPISVRSHVLRGRSN